MAALTPSDVTGLPSDRTSDDQDSRCETTGTSWSITTLRGGPGRNYSPKLMNLQNIQDGLRRHHSYHSGSSSTSIMGFTESRYWIKSSQADCFFATAIVLHSIVIGIDVEVVLDGKSSTADAIGRGVLPDVLAVVRGLLILVFSMELLLRFYAWGSHFLCSFNGIFDTFLVIFAWCDMVLWLAGVEFTGQAEGVLRACRLLRLVRISRLFAIVPALRLLSTGLLATLVTSLWTVGILLLSAYAGALLCTDLLAESVPEFHGNLFASMLTHIKLALMEAWPDIAEPMINESRFWTLYLTAFMLLSNTALLNVVTGVICEKVTDIAHRSPPASVEKWQEEKQKFSDRLWRLFEHVDSDMNETLSEEECLELLKCREMQELLQDMGVGLPLDSEHVHKVLDKDNSGSVDFNELFDGLMRQRGTRNDHQSQTLQYALAQSTHQVLCGIDQAQEATKTLARRSIRRAKRRMLRRLGEAAAKNPCKRQRLPLEEPIKQEDLQGLEDACAELRACLGGLRAAAQGASGAAAAGRRPALPPTRDDGPAAEELPYAGRASDQGCHAAGGSPSAAPSAAKSRSGDVRSPGPDDGPGGADLGGGGNEVAGDLGGRGRAGGKDVNGGCGRSSSSSSSGSSSSSSSDKRCSGSRSSRGRQADRRVASCPRLMAISEQPSLLWTPPRTCGAPGDGFGAQDANPRIIGTVHVHVLGLHGLQSSGDARFLGTFDAYVILHIGSLESRTATACYSLGAAWGFGAAQSFDLQQDKQEASSMVLKAEVMNTWLLRDDSLGVADVALRSLAPGLWHRQRRRLNGRLGGELEFAVHLEEAVGAVESRDEGRSEAWTAPKAELSSPSADLPVEEEAVARCDGNISWPPWCSAHGGALGTSSLMPVATQAQVC